MSIGVDNLVGLRYHVIFYKVFVIQCLQQGVYKGSVGLEIQIIVRMVMIWDKLLFKIIFYFGSLVSRKKLFS